MPGARLVVLGTSLHGGQLRGGEKRSGAGRSGGTPLDRDKPGRGVIVSDLTYFVLTMTFSPFAAEGTMVFVDRL